ncbi:MFS transporter [Thalassotalea piscium]|uniref:PPP family 3-phenylpropionic acid transporter n=1 Tax=Thalassotalea piscium TaxID=1230533 RepID=A0A7X0TS89_9GAMM|nr:MFS transporter [Thalassotalea piscium]MBB6541859.1 PPP family 3-phenylpropionic acid transporter [Thalassotalea piscium]
MSSPLFVRLSSSYFWYFSILGLVVPFLPVFLDGNGFSSIEIGEILAIFTATKIIGPSLWAIIADKSGKQLAVIRLGALLTCICFAMLFFVETYWPMTFALAMFSLFWTAILPQLEVLTLTSIKRSPKIYARVRLWGSIGFIVLAIISGELLDTFGSETFTIIGFIILICLYLSTLFVKQPRLGASSQVKTSRIIDKLLTKGFIMFFIAGLLLQASFGPYNSFFALYLRDLEYPAFAAGLYISIGVIAEIGIFIIAGRLYQLFGAIWLISISMFISAIRWYLTGSFAGSAWILLIVQLMHAASFGLYHSASIQYLQQHFAANQQNRGQAIYIGGVYGVGGALGAYIAGVLWQGGIGATQAFNYAAIVALIGAIVTLLMKEKHTLEVFK